MKQVIPEPGCGIIFNMIFKAAEEWQILDNHN